MISQSESRIKNLTLRDELDSVATFVMAGGKGERLFPLTKDRAKPAVGFGGIYRIIDFTLSNCVNSGIRKIYVLTQYKSYSLARHIKLGWNMLPAELREYVEVVPAQQRYGEFWYRGTADAIYQNIYTIERENCERVLILAGDHIYKMDYLRMLQFHIENDSDVTLGVIEMPISESEHYGILEVDSEHRILEFEEKPQRGTPIPGKPDRVFASMGIYLFNRDTLFKELIEAQKSENRHDFGKDIIPAMINRKRLFAYPFEDKNPGGHSYWRDIGTLDAFFEANMDLIQVEPRFNLYDESWPIRTRQPQYPPAKTVLFEEYGYGARRGEVFESLISSGCIVSGGYVRRSILSPRVRVHSYARVENSVLMDYVEVGRYAKIRNAIVDKYAQIVDGTEVGYDLEKDRARFKVTRNGIVVIPKASIVGPDDVKERWPQSI
jgi:glucose-1-phosphate adenylyltransferase